MQDNTIWINVTTSENWNRPAVGIVRVEKRICEELENIYSVSRIKKCIWKNNQFEELSVIEKEITVKNEVPQKAAPLFFPVLSKKEALYRIGQGFFSLIPRPLRPHLSKILTKIKPLLYKAYKPFRPKKNTTYIVPQKTIQFIKSFPFKNGDVFVTMGLDWDYPYVAEFYKLKEAGIHIISVCYDLIPILFPQLSLQNVARKFSSYFIDIAEFSSAILCISKQTESDLKNFISETGARNVRTEVIHLGSDFCNKSYVEKNLINGKYILFVSSIERRKNHEVLYKAYHILCSKGLKTQIPKLVLVGMPGWGVDDLMRDILEDPVIEGMITILNRVSDSELLTLYSNSEFCVYPSLYEGWGLPVCEALEMGKLVLSSNCGSLREAGDSFVDYLDPWNPNEWATSIYKYFNNPNLVREREEYIKNNFKPYSWGKTASKVKEVIESL